MTITVDWKGKIGYGDIVSPICYAHNVSYKLQTKVRLNFHWDKDINEKIASTDPETLWQRANIIHGMCVKKDTQVDVFHFFNSPMSENHTNYDWSVVGSDPYHNYWMPRNKCIPDERDQLIVVNSTTNNMVSLADYGKSWKDPVAGRWPDIVKKLKRNYTVVEVNYSTKLDDLVLYLKKAIGFVGYHGTAAWVARFMHTPSIIFSESKSLTWSSFPYAVSETDISKIDTWIDHIKKGFDLSNDRAFEFASKYPAYRLSKQFEEHLHHDEQYIEI